MTTLRELRDADLDLLFEWERDPGAVQAAAFTREDPDDREAFDAHYARNRANPDVTMRAIEDDGELVGMIASFTMEGEREITYWIDPARWGQGHATAALAALLAIDTTRPIRARIADHNVGSTKVVTRAGFVRVRGETGFANALGREVSESVYVLR